MHRNSCKKTLFLIGCGIFSFAVVGIADRGLQAAQVLPVKDPTQVAAPRDSADSYTISDNVNLVVLDVSVKDPRGGYVAALPKEDFRVYDDGQLRTISQFSNQDTPVTIGLVVDDSGSMVRKRPEVVLAGLAFAKESNSRDEFFVVNFNNYVVSGLPQGTDFTDNLQNLRRALFYGSPVGQTALYDAIAYSLRHLEKSSQEKRTLIVVSDGGDNVSKTSFPELLKLVEASRATIYTVGLFDQDERDRNPTILRALSKMTGGEFFEPSKLDDVVPVFHKIANDIRNRYTIAYMPDDPNNKHQIRSIRVSAQSDDHRKLVVKTRTSYSTAHLSQLVARQNRKETQDSPK